MGAIVTVPPAALATSQWCTAASCTWWRTMNPTFWCCAAHVQHGAAGSAAPSTSTSRAAPSTKPGTNASSGGRGGRSSVSGGADGRSAAIFAQNQCTSVRCHTRSATDQAGQCSTRAVSAPAAASANPALWCPIASRHAAVESGMPGR
jgi:hypothetical protein